MLLYAVVFVRLKGRQTEGKEVKTRMDLKRIGPHLTLEQIRHQAVSESSSLPAASDVGFFSFKEH